MPSLDVLLNALVTLFVMIDPIGTAPIFLGLTVGVEASRRRGLAVRGTLIAFVVLSLFALTGTSLLDAMGITIDAFRVAGGLLLFYTAFEMLYARREERRTKTSSALAEEHLTDLAVFPLAIPLLAGPGAISATILLSSELGAAADERWYGTAWLIALLFALLSATALVMVAAEALDKYFGRTGKLVVTRLLGVLLAALSVQYVADGVRALAAV